jgi:AcrR family transcriptional regulator
MTDLKTSESTYQRILSAAAIEVTTFGSERATVVSIARSAAMTHANVYRHFESKTALFDAITQTWIKPIEAKLHEIADAPDPARDKLERFLFAIIQAYRNRIEANPRLFSLFVDAFRENRSLARQHRSKIRTLLDRVLEEGVHSGAFTIRNRERATALIFDTLYRFVQPEAIELDIEIQRRSWETRLGSVTTMLLNTLGNLDV